MAVLRAHSASWFGVSPDCTWKLPRLLVLNVTDRWMEKEDVVCMYSGILCCCCLVAKLHQTLWDSVGCNPPGSSGQGTSQARAQYSWVAISFSRDLPNPRIEPPSPAESPSSGGFYPTEPPGKPHDIMLLRHEKEWNNEILPSAATWMGLEIIIPSEESQKEKDKYHRILLICGIWKKWYKWTYFQNRRWLTDIENKFMVIKGKRGREE